ncbi:MAG: colicin-like pore-forming protein [Bacteroidota bacterium]
MKSTTRYTHEHDLDRPGLIMFRDSLKTLAFRLSCIAMLLFCCLQQTTAQQGVDSTAAMIKDIPAKYFDKVSKKAEGLEGKLDKKSGKALRQFEKQKDKLQQRLSKVDSLSAAKIFGNVDKQYQQLTEKIKQPARKLTKYIPSLDTMGGSLQFLDQYKGALKNTKELQSAITKVNDLKSQFQKAEDIKAFLKQQKQYLKDNLEKFGMAKQLKTLNKQAYYYGQQLKEYKETLKDQDKIEKKTIELLSKTKPFQDFMKKNSMLASLFRMPADDPNDPAYLQSIAGLQTRAQVNTQMQNQFGSGGGVTEQLQANVQQAQGQLQQLKNKISQAGGSNSDDDMPDFKPNNQKTKSLLQRLEYGTNMQTQQSSGYFPVTSDIGLSLGYKLNDKSIIGIGASYKMGWGQDIKHIQITHQGVGVRSYTDVKLKKSIWLSGGFEMNYRTLITSIDQLKNASSWQQSGLIGLSKKFTIKTKFFKNTNLKLLWDFLSYQQVPRTQPVVFRVGYGIK